MMPRTVWIYRSLLLVTTRAMSLPFEFMVKMAAMVVLCLVWSRFQCTSPKMKRLLIMVFTATLVTLIKPEQ